MSITVLIDYDNLLPLDRTKGLMYISEKVVHSFEVSEMSNGMSVTLRLYGGWYEGGTFTKRAQDLTIDIKSNFPRPICLRGGALQVLVNVELALSLLIAPSEHLLNTYRLKAAPYNLQCDHPSLHGCKNHSCPLIHVYDFINTGRCHGKACKIKPKDLLHKGEQKLVDTMLTSDLFFLTMHSDNKLPIYIVSSDEDFWPSIMTTLLLGSNLIHVHTSDARETPFYYCKNFSKNYLQRKL